MRTSNFIENLLIQIGSRRLFPRAHFGLQASEIMPAVPSSEAKIRAAFAVFDADGSGALSIEELRGVLSRPGCGTRLSDEEIQALIDEFDEE